MIIQTPPPSPLTTLPQTTGYIRLQELLTYLGISEGTFREEMNAGRYPQPYRLSKRRIGWKLSEIVAAVETPQTR